MISKLSFAKHRSGFILPVMLFTVTFIMLTITVIASLGLTSYNLATREVYKVNAQFAADAGLDVAINELNKDSDWSGTSSQEVEVMDHNNTRTTYEIDIQEDEDEDKKLISVVSRTYSPSSSTDPQISRRYTVDVQAVTSGTGVSSVVTGVGGLIMNNNSRITGGDVVVNGTINMYNQSQIGTQNNSVNVRVAHLACPQPPDQDYPQVCGSGFGQPISLSTNARIYGEVHANNQTDGNNMFDPGLIEGQPVEPISLPSYNREEHPVDVERSSSDLDISCPNNGSVTWPANVKINGDISMGNNCRITITGNVWITGNLNTGNQGQIIIDDSLGEDPPVFMVDGSSGFTLSNNGQITPNTLGTGLELRTFWSDSDCSPDCSELSGPDLANSQDQTTINLANNGNAPNSVFISQWSRVRVSNNGSLGAVSGQSIELGNQAVINFTASIPGSDNLTQTWVKRGYMRVFD